jgi:predicted nucleic acid-binding protein
LFSATVARLIEQGTRAERGPRRGDLAHALAASLVTELGRDLLAPEPVIVEVDQLLRSRVGAHAARMFLESLAVGVHTVVNLSPALLRRAVELDGVFADLDLGYADAAVMAIAERDGLVVLTFDFEHFRTTRPADASSNW